MAPPRSTAPGPVIVVSAHPGDHERALWDELVMGLPGTDVTQLSAWATVRRTAGYRALYLFAWQRGRMVGGAQVLLRRLPLLGQVGYVAYGPLVASGAPRRRTVEALAQALETLARRRLRALFVQPMDGEDIVSSLRAQGFRPSRAGIAPAHTVRIDLEASEDELRAGLSKRVRRWTGKWHKAGVHVRRGRAKDVAVLTDLIAHSAEHQGYSGLSSEYVRTLYRHLADEGRVEIFVAEIDGKPAAAELFTACGGVLRSRLTGLDRSGSASRLSVTSALDWEALRWAKREGFAEFDLGGLSHSAATIVRAEGFSPQWVSGPDRFKLAFGGRLHTYPPAVELIPSAVLRHSYDLLSSAAFGRAALGRAREWMRAGPRRSPLVPVVNVPRLAPGGSATPHDGGKAR